MSQRWYSFLKRVTRILFMHSCMKWNGSMRSHPSFSCLNFKSTSISWEPAMCQILCSMSLDMTVFFICLLFVFVLVDILPPLSLSQEPFDLAFCYFFSKKGNFLTICWSSGLLMLNGYKFNTARSYNVDLFSLLLSAKLQRSQALLCVRFLHSWRCCMQSKMK